MKAAIVYKTRDVAENVRDFLKELNVDSKLYEKACEELGNFDFIVSVGGDGTILRILQYLRDEVPIFGINTGRVGILTHAKKEDFKEKLKKALETFEVEKFPRIECLAGDEELIALNEIVFASREVAKMIEAEIFVDGYHIDTLRCDSVIVASQIGSTGYSFSVGGPIVEPYLQAMVISAVAPFRIGWRPLVLKMDRKVKIVAEGLAIADGQKRVFAEEIEVFKSKYPATFFKKERIFEIVKKVREIS